LAELGLVAAQGREGLKTLIGILMDAASRVPDLARRSLQALLGQLDALAQQIGEIERLIQAEQRSEPAARTIPGIGVVGATAIAATVPDPTVFKSGREFAAWIGLVPRQNSTGGKERLGSISKQGDRYLRRLLVVGATAVIRHARTHPDRHPRLMQLLARRPAKVVAIALANKLARIAWAVLAKGETYRAPALVARA
jgi:transposase